MRSTFFKWLLIVCIAVSFGGRPWAQALAATSPHGCGSAAMQMTDATGHHPGQSASATAAGDYDVGHAMSGACVKACAAVPLLSVPVFVWVHDASPDARPEAAGPMLNGHPPRPELSPPIV